MLYVLFLFIKYIVLLFNNHRLTVIFNIRLIEIKNNLKNTKMSIIKTI